MKIAFIITGLATGGAEMMLLKLLSALDRQRFMPIVITLTGGEVLPRIEALGVPVHCMNFQSGTLPITGFIRLVRLLRQLQPDLVQGWMYHGNLAATLVVKNHVPMIWGIHHSLQDLSQEKPLTRLIVRIKPWLTKGVQKIVYCSQVSQHQHEIIGYPKAKSIFIPNGFDYELFYPDPQAAKWLRAELKLPDDALLIGHAARFHPMKNHLGLIHAFIKIAQDHPMAYLVMVGPEVTSENTTLMEIITTTGSVRGRVHLLGLRRDIHHILPAFDIYVSSSSWGEAFPLVLGEAMASVSPVLN